MVRDVLVSTPRDAGRPFQPQTLSHSDPSREAFAFPGDEINMHHGEYIPSHSQQNNLSDRSFANESVNHMYREGVSESLSRPWETHTELTRKRQYDGESFSRAPTSKRDFMAASRQQGLDRKVGQGDRTGTLDDRGIIAEIESIVNEGRKFNISTPYHGSNVSNLAPSQPIFNSESQQQVQMRALQAQSSKTGVAQQPQKSVQQPLSKTIQAVPQDSIARATLAPHAHVSMQSSVGGSSLPAQAQLQRLATPHSQNEGRNALPLMRSLHAQKKLQGSPQLARGVQLKTHNTRLEGGMSTQSQLAGKRQLQPSGGPSQLSKAFQNAQMANAQSTDLTAKNSRKATSSFASQLGEAGTGLPALQSKLSIDAMNNFMTTPEPASFVTGKISSQSNQQHITMPQSLTNAAGVPMQKQNLQPKAKEVIGKRQNSTPSIHATAVRTKTKILKPQKLSLDQPQKLSLDQPTNLKREATVGQRLLRPVDEEKKRRLEMSPAKDQAKLLNPDYTTPFENDADVWKRLLVYHMYYMPNTEECSKEDWLSRVSKLESEYRQLLKDKQAHLASSLKRSLEPADLHYTSQEATLSTSEGLIAKRVLERAALLRQKRAQELSQRQVELKRAQQQKETERQAEMQRAQEKEKEAALSDMKTQQQQKAAETMLHQEQLQQPFLLHDQLQYNNQPNEFVQPNDNYVSEQLQSPALENHQVNQGYPQFQQRSTPRVHLSTSLSDQEPMGNFHQLPQWNSAQQR